MDEDIKGLMQMAMQELHELCETAADLAGETDALTARWNKVEAIQEQLDKCEGLLMLSAEDLNNLKAILATSTEPYAKELLQKL